MSRARPCAYTVSEVMPVLTVAKFGGSSLADSRRFLEAAKLIRDDPARAVVVVSAAGKRQSGDAKITDLLYLCHTHLACGVSCWDLFRRIRERYTEIRDGCGLSINLDDLFEQLYNSLFGSADLAASRGEYLSARLMAEVLGYEFCDAASWLRFGHDGCVDFAASRALLREKAAGKRVVIPGFYGLDHQGKVKVFSRGGSDVTGAIAAAALDADLYENHTDVDGGYSADPRLTDLAAPVGALSYSQLQFLTAAGMQVLHPDAVEPVARQEIPLRICSAARPHLPGTVISSKGTASRLTVAGQERVLLQGHDGEAALVAAVFPEELSERILAALKAVDHVILERSDTSLRVLTAPEDFGKTVELLHKAQNSC